MKIGDLVKIFTGKNAKPKPAIIVQADNKIECLQVLWAGNLHWVYIDNIKAIA